MKRRAARGAIRRALVGALLMLSASQHGLAHAEGQHVLLVAPTDNAFTARVRGEIQALGFTVDRADLLPTESAPSVVAAARIIDVPSRRVELWTADETGGRLVLRAVIEHFRDDDSSTDSVRASEQLRAYLQPLRDLAPDPSSQAHHAPDAAEGSAADSLPPRFTPTPRAPAEHRATEPPDAAAPHAEAPARRFSTTAAIAVPIQLGRPGLDVALGGRWMATRGVGLGALVALPLVPSDVAGADGPLRMRALVFGGEVSALLLDTRFVGLSVSAGFAGAWVTTAAEGGLSAPAMMVKQPSARTMPPATPPSLVTGLPFVGVEVAPRLTARLRLYLAGNVGVSTTEVLVVLPSGVRATWGRPLGWFSAGLSVDL
jgi:hypothetical protein